MKIAVYHELPKGGARRAINEFSNALGKKNIVDLFVVDVDYPKVEEKYYDKIYFSQFISRKWTGKDIFGRLYKDTIEIFKLYKLTRKIANDIDKKNYDVVIVSASQYIEAPFIMRFLKTPFVFYCSDPNFRFIYEPILQPSRSLGALRYRYELLKRFIFKYLDKENIKHAPKCFAPSTYIAELFTKTYGKKNEAVHYGVDTAFFTPDRTVKDIDILYIGSYAPIDGLDLLDGALAKMTQKPVVRKVIGEEEWISDDRELRSLYRRSKIMFCPAHKEGLGAVLMESMSCGTIVVAVNEAGHKETMIDGKTGFLVPRDVKKVATTFKFILDNPKKRQEMERFCRKEMKENWTWSVRAKSLEKVLQQYLSTNSTRLA